MPSLAPATPLKIFPPPITIAISLPCSCIFLISSAYSAKRFGSIPYLFSTIRSSSLNFRSIRLYFILRKNLFANIPFLRLFENKLTPSTAIFFLICSNEEKTVFLSKDNSGFECYLCYCLKRKNRQMKKIGFILFILLT